MSYEIKTGDALETLLTLSDESISCCVTSPPYWGLRDYGVGGQLGLESTPEEYTDKLVAIFREVRRVLKPEGTLWLNLGDTYAAARGGSGMPAETLAGGQNGHGDEDSHRGRGSRESYNPKRDCTKYGLKHKDLVGIPWMAAFALRKDGWYLRQDIIWQKFNSMPESVKDRCTKSHEYIFLMSKSEKYYYDYKAIMEPAVYGQQHADKTTSWGTNRKHPNKANIADYAFTGDNKTCYKDERGYMKNKRSVWNVSTKPYKGAHFAVFPPELITPCIFAGSKVGDTVLDPFSGSGTTGVVCLANDRNYLGIELNPEYVKLSHERISQSKLGLR